MSSSAVVSIWKERGQKEKMNQKLTFLRKKGWTAQAISPLFSPSTLPCILLTSLFTAQFEAKMAQGLVQPILKFYTMCTYALWVQHITPLLLPSTGPVCTRINPAYCGGIIMWSMQYLKQSRVCMQYAVMKSWSRPEVLSSNERSHILSFLNATFLSCKPNMFSSERTLPV